MNNDDIKFLESQQYVHISDVITQTEERLLKIKNGELFPILTSSRKEEIVMGGYYPGDQVVIAGRTGCGKTAKIIQDMQDFLDWNINSRWKDKVIILYDSFEMTGWRNYLRVLSSQLSMSVKQLIDYKVRLANEQFERIKQVGLVFKNKPLFISSEMVDGARWYNQKSVIHDKFPNHLIINVLDHTRLILKNNEKTEEQKLTGLMMNAMRLKNRTECINIFLSQMNRNIENGIIDRSEIGSRTPVMSDLFGSDAIGQCADVVMALHRPGQYGLDVFSKQGTSIPTSKIVDGSKVDYLLLECILKNRDGALKDIAMDHNLAHNKIVDLNLS